jgi:hypothetical protein
MDIDFPLTRHPWMSKQSNFKSRPMNLPANSPVDAVVMVMVILLLAMPDNIWGREQLRHHERDDCDRLSQSVIYVEIHDIRQ